MTGILNALMASSGVSTLTFNLTSAVIPAGNGAGYCDGTAGTNGGAAGTISASSLGRAHIAEVGTFNGTPSNLDIIWIKGFSSDPGINYLISVTINGATQHGSSATYTYDAVNGVGKWVWNVAWAIFSGNTYNNNTITHAA